MLNPPFTIITSFIIILGQWDSDTPCRHAFQSSCSLKCHAVKHHSPQCTAVVLRMMRVMERRMMVAMVLPMMMIIR